jgi:hypothetical protein
METALKKFTDPYERKACLYPALLAALPVIVLIALYTDWITFDVENALYIAVAAAGLFWLTGKTRDLGKVVEHRLVIRWAGMPSMTLLRHRDSVLDRYTKQRYHKAAAVLADVSLPDPAEEENDPADADERYRAVTTALLSKTRDTSEYSLIFKENINYGFWRNLRGVKLIACALAVAMVAVGLWIDRALLIDLQAPEGTELAVVLTGIMIFFSWVTTVTDEAVRRAAQNYALRLLEALDKT